jgi:hypothetical protein
MIPVFKQSKTVRALDCMAIGTGIYRAISLLPTTYKILSSSLVSRLTPYMDESNEDHQHGF